MRRSFAAAGLVLVQAATGPLEALHRLNPREFVPDSREERFIARDQAGAIYLVSGTGSTHLGEAPDTALVAAWAENDYGYAFARKAGSGYEIVGVGHIGSKVLGQASGHPRAMHFVGQGLFFDGPGWRGLSTVIPSGLVVSYLVYGVLFGLALGLADVAGQALSPKRPRRGAMRHE